MAEVTFKQTYELDREFTLSSVSEMTGMSCEGYRFSYWISSNGDIYEDGQTGVKLNSFESDLSGKWTKNEGNVEFLISTGYNDYTKQIETTSFFVDSLKIPDSELQFMKKDGSDRNYPYCKYEDLKNKDKIIGVIDQNGNLTSVGEYSMRNMINLSSVNIPNLQKIGEHAFYNCINLQEIKVNENNQYTYTINGNILVDKSKQEIIWGSIPSLNYVKINDNIMSIGEYAFEKCTNLTYVDTTNINCISNYAFEGSNIKELYMIDKGSDVISIFDNPFNDCQFVITCIVEDNSIEQWTSDSNWSKQIEKNKVHFIKRSEYNGSFVGTCQINLAGVIHTTPEIACIYNNGQWECTIKTLWWAKILYGDSIQVTIKKNKEDNKYDYTIKIDEESADPRTGTVQMENNSIHIKEKYGLLRNSFIELNLNIKK